MRTKAILIKNNLYIIKLTDELQTRLIVTHKDYDLSYELLAVFNEDIGKGKKFDLYEYIKSLDYEKLYNNLIDVNSEENDLLYDDFNIIPLVDDGDSDE